MMDTINNMLVCRRFTKYKQQWIHFNTIQLIHTIIILAVCGNTIVPSNASANIPSDQIDCTTYDSCSQCINGTACEWLFEKQSCVVSDQIFTSENTSFGKSCPRFEVTTETNKTKNIKIKVMISKGEEHFKIPLEKNEIKCEVGEELKNVTVENDNTISCNYSVPHALLQSCHDLADKRNPLFIEYFSIVFGGDVRLKFDKVRDHYLAVYPCGLLVDGTSCSVFSKCTTASWDDGPNQYYCKWCLENKKCPSVLQEGKCYARDTTKGTPSTVGNVVRVRGDDVGIEGFSPSEGPATGDTTLTVKIRGHAVLGGVYETTAVTAAGRECRDPKTLADGETVTCTVAAGPTAAAGGPTSDDRGPVVVTYRAAGRPAVELSSAGASFAFAGPRADGRACDREPSVEPEQSLAGIASGGTRLTVRGSFECAADPRLYVWFYDVRKYGAGCAMAADAAALECLAPELPESATAAVYDVGVQWTFGGRTVYANISGGHYAPRPDPVFTDFRVDGGGDGQNGTVTVHGQNVDHALRDDVTVRLLSARAADGDAGDECVVQWVDQTSVTCTVAASSPGGSGGGGGGGDNRLAADASALVIWVGRHLNQTIDQRPVDQSDRPERLLAGAVVPVGIFSGFILMVFVVTVLVKATISRARRQRKKWYMQQLRDITADIDEESL